MRSHHHFAAIVFAAIVASLLRPSAAGSHGFEPAILDITELPSGRARVDFRPPSGPADSAAARDALRLIPPARCHRLDEVHSDEETSPVPAARGSLRALYEKQTGVFTAGL